MDELKKILFKLFLLLADILIFGFHTVKQIALPNRQRKGNLLSTVFIFFVGMVERLNYFEHGIFSMAAVFRKKYIRQAIFVIGGILFLLSLFEWTGDQRTTYSEANKYSEQLSSIPRHERPETTSANVIVSCTAEENSWKVFGNPFIAYHSVTFPSSVNRFLLLKCIRV